MRHFEDFAVGDRFAAPSATVSAEDIEAFAARFDPQPFHLDAGAAERSLFGRQIASGWHTAALTMRLLVGSELKIAGGLIGRRVDSLEWPRPVVPGDRLSVVAEVIETRQSARDPARGYIRIRVTTTNQDALPVQVMTALMVVPRRVVAV